MRRIKHFPHFYPPLIVPAHSHHHHHPSRLPLRSNFHAHSRSQSDAPQFKFRPDFYVLPPVPSNTPPAPPALPIPPAIPQVHKQKQERKAKAFEELSFKAWKKRQRKAWRNKQRKASENTSPQTSTSRLTEPLYSPAPEHLRKDAREPCHEPSTSELKKDGDASLIVTERSDVREVEVEEQVEKFFRYLTALPFPDFISTIRTHYHYESHHDPPHDQQTLYTLRSHRSSQSQSSSPPSSSSPKPRTQPWLSKQLRRRVKRKKLSEREVPNLMSDSEDAADSGTGFSSLTSPASSPTSSAPVPAPAPFPPRTFTSRPWFSPLLPHRLYPAQSIYGFLIRPGWIEKAKEGYRLSKEAQIGGDGGGGRGWRWRVGKHRVGFGRKTIPIESKTC